MNIKTWGLSGFGGGYESTCQKMLWNAVRFLSDNNREIETEQCQNIYGIAINKGKDGEAFDKAMMEGVGDATGAMHHCATNHALYIGKNGYKKWFNELKKHRKNEHWFIYKYEYDFQFAKEDE